MEACTDEQLVIWIRQDCAEAFVELAKRYMSLIQAKMDILDSCFNLAEDEDVVEACIFERKALNARYSHLLKKAKELNIKTQLLREHSCMERSYTG